MLLATFHWKKMPVAKVIYFKNCKKDIKNLTGILWEFCRTTTEFSRNLAEIKKELSNLKIHSEIQRTFHMRKQHKMTE